MFKKRLNRVLSKIHRTMFRLRKPKKIFYCRLIESDDFEHFHAMRFKIDQQCEELKEKIIEDKFRFGDDQ
jgi:hypothetical protein